MIPATLAPHAVPLPTATVAPPPAAASAPTGGASVFEAVLRGPAHRPSAVDPADLGARVLDKISGFRARAEGARSLADAGARTGAQSAAAPAAASAGQTAAAAEPGGDMRAMMRLVVQTFDFATETHLVAKAATQMTGSMNTLLRGQ